MPNKRDALATTEDQARALLAARPKLQRNRAWDAKRTRMTYDLPQETIDAVKATQAALAHTFGGDVRVGDVADLLLREGIKRYRAGEMDIHLHPRRLGLS